ncbi:MAG: hypothetical protein IPN93_08970 [Bacteroidetes bacterium]|nr:hypothetical protein [Bacteroidota bacterium]
MGCLRLHTEPTTDLRIVHDGKVLTLHESKKYVCSYDPYGMNMPSFTTNEWQKHSLNPTYYRYGYQGQFAEKDQETGLNSFELRMWDARIARWLSKDPANQYWSPYMGMGNRPMSTVDPDGAFATQLGAFLYSLRHGGEVNGNRKDGFTVSSSFLEPGYYLETTQVVAGRKGNKYDAATSSPSFFKFINPIESVSFDLERTFTLDFGFIVGANVDYRYHQMGLGKGMGAYGNFWGFSLIDYSSNRDNPNDPIWRFGKHAAKDVHMDISVGSFDYYGVYGGSTSIEGNPFKQSLIGLDFDEKGNLKQINLGVEFEARLGLFFGIHGSVAPKLQIKLK